MLPLHIGFVITFFHFFYVFPSAGPITTATPLWVHDYLILSVLCLICLYIFWNEPHLIKILDLWIFTKWSTVINEQLNCTISVVNKIYIQNLFLTFSRHKLNPFATTCSFKLATFYFLFLYDISAFLLPPEDSIASCCCSKWKHTIQPLLLWVYQV